MTAQQLREMAEAVIAAREGWRDVGLEPNGLEAWSKLHQARDALANAADAEEILALLDQLAAAEKDAERLDKLALLISSGTRIEFAKSLFGNGVEIGLLHPPLAYARTDIRAAIDAALNPAREDVK